MTPKFVRTDGPYYFEIQTDTIYGKEYGSKDYWHEYSHWLDHRRVWYRTLSVWVHTYVQFISNVAVMIFIILSFFDSSSVSIMLYHYALLMLFYGAFSLQEEIRANVYGFLKSRRFKNR